MSSTVHVDNKGKNILILGEGPTQWLNTTLTAEAKYPTNFTQSEKRFVLSLCYNGSNGFFFTNAKKLYHFEAINLEIKDHVLYLDVPKYFTIDNMKKIGLKEVVKIFSVDFKLIDTKDILDIQKYLMKRTWYKIMFELNKKIFIGLLTGIVNESDHTKCSFFH